MAFGSFYSYGSKESFHIQLENNQTNDIFITSHNFKMSYINYIIANLLS